MAIEELVKTTVIPLSHKEVVEKEVARILGKYVFNLFDENKPKTIFFVFGNGGSATDAQHFTGELLGRFSIERPPLPALSLSGEIAAMTAIANDYSYEDVFIRQLKAFIPRVEYSNWQEIGEKLQKKGFRKFAKYVVIGLSTSGTSKNVVKALQEIKERNPLETITIFLTGLKKFNTIPELLDKAFGKRKPSPDYVFYSTEKETPLIQKDHYVFLHDFAEQIDRLYKKWKICQELKEIVEEK